MSKLAWKYYFLVKCNRLHSNSAVSELETMALSCSCLTFVVSGLGLAGAFVQRRGGHFTCVYDN